MVKRNLNSKNFKTILLFIIAIALIIIIVELALLGKKFENNSNLNEINASVENNNTDYDETIEMTNIETPYCTLMYPTEYYSKLKLEDSTEGNIFSKTFSYVYGEELIELFVVHFNNPDEGYKIGFILKDGEKVPLTIELCDYDQKESFEEEELDNMRIMQEAVNDMIDLIMTDKNFISE